MLWYFGYDFGVLNDSSNQLFESNYVVFYLFLFFYDSICFFFYLFIMFYLLLCWICVCLKFGIYQSGLSHLFKVIWIFPTFESMASYIDWKRWVKAYFASYATHVAGFIEQSHILHIGLWAPALCYSWVYYLYWFISILLSP